MKKVNTNISLDPELKKEAIGLFNSFGLDLSTAISLFLSQSVREGRIPFEVRLVNNKKKVEENKPKGEGYDNVDQLMEDIKE